MLRTAIKFILYDKPKSIGALAGAIISIFLIGQQLGVFIFMTSAMASLVNANRHYIWVVGETTTNVNALMALDIRVGRELESIPGVNMAYPVVVAGAAAKFENGKSSNINLIGSVAPNFCGGPWNLVACNKADMIQSGAIITEYFDRKTLGNALPGDYFEINGNKVFITGNTRGVRSFGTGPYAFTTLERARALTGFSPIKVSAYLVMPATGFNPDDVIHTINSTINGVHAWTGDEFATATIFTVLKSGGIAISIGAMIFFAIISGFVIIGLTLYSATVDRIKDYGTLKAIGADNRFVAKLILCQATIFSIVGFIIGYALVEGFRQGVAQTGTIFMLPLWLKGVMFLVSLGIALAGSSFAILRIVKLEPAQAFRG